MADSLLDHALDGDATTTSVKPASELPARPARFSRSLLGRAWRKRARNHDARWAGRQRATLATVCVGAVSRVVSSAAASSSSSSRPSTTLCGRRRVRRDGLRSPGRPADVAGTVPPGVGRRLAVGRRHAASRNYATDAQRKQLASLGRRFGCHTCGVVAVQWIADHQPPQKIAALRDARWWKSRSVPRRADGARASTRSARPARRSRAPPCARYPKGASCTCRPVRPFHPTHSGAPLSRAAAPGAMV